MTPVDIPVHFDFGEESDGRSRILYESGDSERLQLTILQSGLYRVEESSFAGDALYGDIIRADETLSGELLFREIVTRSPLITQSWVISANLLASEPLQKILVKVMEVGGMWELAFGGLLFLHLPENLAKEIHDEVNSLTLQRGTSP